MTISMPLGNVAVIIMAEDNIKVLDENTQRFGWVLMAWVSTVAGNFTLAGSAANIIVAEKAMRHGAKAKRGGGEFIHMLVYGFYYYLLVCMSCVYVCMFFMYICHICHVCHVCM